MKLSLEQHSELSEMARHFNKIEEIAERMGIEVDSLVEKCQQNFHTAHLNLKPNLQTLSTKRLQVFRQASANGNSDRTSIVNLTVVVNEDRF